MNIVAALFYFPVAIYVRSRVGIAGQADEESKLILDKLRDLRLKAKLIEASLPNSKKKTQMLMALAKVIARRRYFALSVIILAPIISKC